MYILICTLVVMGSSYSEENLNLLFDLLYHLVLNIQRNCCFFSRSMMLLQDLLEARLGGRRHGGL